MNTTDAVSAIVRGSPGARYVTSLGTSTSALRLASNDGPHLYLGGSMGSGLAVAIGVADRCRDQNIVAIIGDGDLLMGSSALWTLAGLRLANLKVFVICDGAYAITGGQNLICDSRCAGVGAALGLRTQIVATQEELENCLADDAVELVETRVEAGAEWPGPSPFVDPYRVRTRFAEALGNEKYGGL